ncbi:phage tail assembly chaperone [Sphingomonas sp. PAMC 26621]|uniref:phage tail assembly chaperone n=1 Tax=Sphingomonas sp. PAMC 26621 TaxID=1112213 RepID=UPI000289993C|nr:phage tail assembly chaperone [Sphingomonas sp. PAMC 26621]
MERFAEASVRLAGLAGAVLGWGPEVFWHATPAELGAVVAVLTGGGDAVVPPDAATIARMQEAFPDGG